MQPIVVVAVLAGLFCSAFPSHDDTVEAASAVVEEASEFPALLSQTSYFKNVRRLELADDFTAYRVNAAPWSDGAFKQRFVRLPKGKSATFREDRIFDFPVGTVFVQNVLMLPDDLRLRRLETRVIELRKDGPAFATYVWRADQREADRTDDGGRVDIETERSYQRWTVSPISKCSKCHEEKAAPLLGVTARQLNAETKSGNQLEQWKKRGLLQGLDKPTTDIVRLVDPKDEAHSLDVRARSYLDVNCASCHRPNGNGSGTMDLRFGVPRERAGLGTYNEIMLDGKPFESWVFLRMIYTDRQQMPSELTTLVDREGADLIRDWVDAATSSSH